MIYIQKSHTIYISSPTLSPPIPVLSITFCQKFHWPPSSISAWNKYLPIAGHHAQQDGIRAGHYPLRKFQSNVIKNQTVNCCFECLIGNDSWRFFGRNLFCFSTNKEHLLFSKRTSPLKNTDGVDWDFSPLWGSGH